ncbi:aquaglyceroporin, putative [Talaromyces stipitatus ATCC 10500]|uniref:Aquaglyceroporin, putative n=1 Tax=Talaromyces stipitatus (strain ATCC 10500 / CBS 375.48 / QM 6759 / NRRL 1006) TaxID=441959 RepID=B8LVJ4_TALSN|nr:aquaglyceroporin, putative [Talaromyces stipitatus ATCC 10500]EED24013.1 aquaglyceroporin, putative [Talaromyces stipitatus ATCC 10500]
MAESVPSRTRSLGIVHVQPTGHATTRAGGDAGTAESGQTPTSPAHVRRRATTLVSPRAAAPAMKDYLSEGTSLRLRRTTTSRRSGEAVRSLTHRTSLAERTQGNFTMAGPDETSQLHLTHQPFIQPGYTELNPAYDQPANAKPVWSLAKPLPRVVRPGMVPTKEELLQNRANPQLPAENSQNIGIDVDPNDLEKGQIPKTADPRKMAAQVTDARVQRETNFINTILNGDTASVGPSSRISRQSSGRARRPSKWEVPVEELPPVEEHESQKDHDVESRTDVSDESLHSLRPPPEESGQEPHPDVKPGDEAGIEFPALEDTVYPEDLHPLLQSLVEEEIHNNHTVWSVIRTHHREALAESLGVFVQLTLGFCGDLAVTLAASGNPNTTDWLWGFATMAAIYICGGISGAHLNPAITIMLWFYRGFPKRKMPEYFLAQFVGAFCAALVSYGVYYRAIKNYTGPELDVVNSLVTSQREDFVDAATAFFNEFLGMAILSIIILALGDDQNAPPGGGMNALIIGLVIVCMDMCFAFQTGAAFNASRDFGPRLALLALGYGSQLFTNSYWFYGPFAASVTGSFLGAFLYDFMIFTGGESPVNYPLDRTKRSLKKSRAKWSRRLHLTPKEAKKGANQ